MIERAVNFLKLQRRAIARVVTNWDDPSPELRTLFQVIEVQVAVESG